MGDSPVRSNAAPSSRGWRWLAWSVACAPLLLLLGHQIATSWFLCDDAFILFRYTRNLVAGNGLVFNRGERVEGFVDLLWVLELAGMWRLGWRPEIAAPVLSLVCTAGTLLLVVANAARLAKPSNNPAIGWLAFGLVASSASFAVWSTGGMETRQFTMLIVAGSFLLTSQRPNRRQLVAAAVVFAAAEGTRPEGLLLFGCAVLWRLVQDRLDGDLRWSRLLCLVLPFVLLVAGHFLWRHAYYGEWLPNPYYAKHVQPWYEVGFTFLAAAAIELGAWLWVPLALVAVASRAAVRDLSPALPFVLTIAHGLYLLRIGGDHFEYRPLDFYLPLLAAPAAAGLAQLLAWAVAGVGVEPAARDCWARRLTFVAGVPMLVYASTIGAASMAVAMTRQEPLDGLRARTRLDANSAPPLRWVPGLLPLCDILEPLREKLHRHLVAVPAQVHRTISEELVAGFAPYERLPDGIFPADAVTNANTVGVMPFYLRDLTVIDVHGLTDATVARTPATADNGQRRMAHDRHATWDYLRQRGVNVRVAPAAPDAEAALRAADFALRVNDRCWLPLFAVDREYAQRAFPKDRLLARHHVDSKVPEANQVLAFGKAYTGSRLLATFEPDAAAELTWTCTGLAAVQPARQLLMGGVGSRQLSSAGPDGEGAGVGAARSSEFAAEAGTTLVMFLAGQRALGLGVSLCRGDEVLRTFSPPSTEGLQPVVCPLDAWSGQQLHFEVADRGAGWLVLDHVLLGREGADPRAASSVGWSSAAPPLSGCVQIAPLRQAEGRAVSGPTTFTVINPLPCPIAISCELVEGPANASLLTGPWSLAADGSPVLEIPAGATARMPASLLVAAGTSIAAQPFMVRLHVRAMRPDSMFAAEPILVDLPLPWQP